ncbi:hypothetical protein [Christiangramia sediminis]|uniref:hypothetical protein n=1 Tax=Christiangramia sediminis TaxID=2881336 RepID=UPI001E5700A4|nr:hypothetical protein [Christiangramia sediminis]
MFTQDKSNRNSDLEFFRAARKNINKIIYIAIAIIIVLAVVAMTGVYYEYW